MICDKCGKSNIQELSKCAYCGADMPKVSAGGGFADILSYNVAGVKAPSPVKPDMPEYKKEKSFEGISELDMQRLMKKSDNIIKSTKINTLFGLVAIGLSVLILISSIIFGFVTISTVKNYKEDTMAQIEETKKELNEYKDGINKILAEIEKKDNIGSNILNNEESGTRTTNENSQENRNNNNLNEDSNEQNPSSSPRTGAEDNIN